MKRDMDLIRQILLFLEDIDTFDTPLKMSVEEFDQSIIDYHIYLLNQAGLIKAFDFSADEYSDWRASHLTWQGHEFLAVAKDDTRWNKVKTAVKKHGGSATFEVVKTLLSELLKEQMFGK